MTMKTNLLKIFLLALLVAAAAALPAAQDKDKGAAKPPLQCISLSSIRRVTILDNSHLVFQMNNGDRYLNTLPYTCPGLAKNQTIMYRTSLNRLCDVDVITVLESLGQGYSPRASCGLGSFKPVTDKELNDLKTQLEGKKQK